MQIQFEWIAVVPTVISILYTCISCRTLRALGCRRSGIRFTLSQFVPTLAVAVLWSGVGLYLPLLYALLLAAECVRLYGAFGNRFKESFFVNACFIPSAVLFSIFIGVASLCSGRAMGTFVGDPFFRCFSLSAVYAVRIGFNALLLRFPGTLRDADTQTGSAEFKPYMLFVWFCSVYLLSDGALTFSEASGIFIPIFLIASSFFISLCLILFTVHVESVIRKSRLEIENDALTAELESRGREAEQLKQVSWRDELTGLYTRRYALDRIGFFIQGNEPFALVFIDIDKLKYVNDTGGHDAGDAYLSEFASKIGAIVGNDTVFARIGGDEFLLLLPGKSVTEAKLFMRSVRTELERDDWPYPNSFSYGIAAFTPGDEIDDASLIRAADAEMYRDKRRREESDA